MAHSPGAHEVRELLGTAARIPGTSTIVLRSELVLVLPGSTNKSFLLIVARTQVVS
jgi:hypothetical protein